MADDVSRRAFVKGAALVAGGAALGVGGTLAWTAGTPPEAGDPFTGTSITSAGRPVTAEGLTARLEQTDESATLATTGQWGVRPAAVYVVPVATLKASTKTRGYNTGQHAVALPGDSTQAALVYDGKCTHMGCTVGWADELGASPDIPDYTGDGLVEGRILCPCHNAQFDIYDLATHVKSGPAPHPLDVIRVRFVKQRPLHGEQEGETALLGMERIPQNKARAADRQGPGAPFGLDN